jgi:hypothetical protein
MVHSKLLDKEERPYKTDNMYEKANREQKNNIRYNNFSYTINILETPKNNKACNQNISDSRKCGHSDKEK